MKNVIISALLLCTFSGFGQPSSGVHQQLDELIAAAQGKRIGMITNPSGCDESGNSDVNYLTAAHGTTITAFFAPEHGIRGDIMGSGGDYIDPVTGIPVWAIYGVRNAPTDEQLANVDLLVFDMQDVGVRFYTFVWSMTYSMEAAARNGKPFYVIDRPNPIGGLRVEGAANTVDYAMGGRLGAGASIGLATRHGMTVGEIAKMWNTEWLSPKVDLHVILARGWTRSQYWTDTGRTFVAPSPNMRTPAAAVAYPGTCIFEASNVSEGRGTTAPFEIIGAPFINAQNYADQLNAAGLAGVQFKPMMFTPTTSNFAGQLCGGVQVVVTNRDTLDPLRMGLVMLKTAYTMYPTQTTITSYAATLMATPSLDSRLRTESVDSIMSGWTSTYSQFMTLRAKYLLYPDTSKVGEWGRFTN